MTNRYLHHWMTPQILKSVDFTKTQSRYLENETVFLQVETINFTLRATFLQKIVL